MKKQSIFVFETSYLIRQGIRSLLNQFFENPEIQFFESFRKLKPAVQRGKPELIISSEPHFGDYAHEWSQLCCQLKCQVLIFVFSDRCFTASGITFVPANSDLEELKRVFLKLLPRTETSNEEISLREKDILSLVAQGFSNKEIGDKLNISINTVTTHRKNITRKLGIKTASGLTVYAILNNLIDIMPGE